MFQNMSPQIMQMMNQGGMPNMAPQIPQTQSQQGGMHQPMPQQPVQPGQQAAPNGGIFGSMASNPMIQGMMGGNAPPSMSSYHGGQAGLPWQQGFSSQTLDNSQIANPANMSGMQGFFARNNPFASSASSVPMTTDGLPVGQLMSGTGGAASSLPWLNGASASAAPTLASAAAPAAANAGAAAATSAAASSMPEWMTALMAFL